MAEKTELLDILDNLIEKEIEDLDESEDAEYISDLLELREKADIKKEV